MAMSAAVPLSHLELSQLVASCWAPDEETYDLERLDTTLCRDGLLYTSPPVISVPSHCLRERFRFRTDKSVTLADIGMHISVLIGQGRELFANHQDFQLAEDVKQNVVDLGMNEADVEIRRTLSDNFHSSDYSQIRLLLEGSRILLATVGTEGLESKTVDQALRTASDTGGSASANNDLDGFSLFGFPALKPAQVQLLTSLDAAQFVELVNYLGDINLRQNLTCSPIFRSVRLIR